MKFLENGKFELLNAALSADYESYIIDGRLESYSCKMTSSDKKLFGKIMQEMDGGSGPNDLHALSPPEAVLSRSPGRRSRYDSTSSDDASTFLCDTISTKTLFYLISTLNASFTDYDFSDTKSDEFSKEIGLQYVVNTIDTQLNPVVTAYESMKSQIWAAIDEEITLADCDIFSYNPDFASDPFGESGQIWSFNYFFYNRKKRRLVFYSCRCSARDQVEMSSDQGYASFTSSELNSRSSVVDDDILVE